MNLSGSVDSSPTCVPVMAPLMPMAPIFAYAMPIMPEVMPVPARHLMKPGYIMQPTPTQQLQHRTQHVRNPRQFDADWSERAGASTPAWPPVGNFVRRTSRSFVLVIFVGFLEFSKFSANLRKTCVLISGIGPSLRKSPQNLCIDSQHRSEPPQASAKLVY